MIQGNPWHVDPMALAVLLLSIKTQATLAEAPHDRRQAGNRGALSSREIIYKVRAYM